MNNHKHRSKISIKIDALQRLIMWHTLSGKFPLYLVAEYPKSGGSWVSQMLSSYFNIPYPRDQRPPLKSCILQGHHLYHSNFKNVFCVIRDGRDIMVSYYFYSLFHNDRNYPFAVKNMRNKMPFNDYENIIKNLPVFIEYLFTKEKQGLFHFSWDEFVRSWSNKGVPIIRYEDLLISVPDALGTAIQKVTGEQPDMEKLRTIEKTYSFQNLTKRKKGAENKKSFLRKGIAGDWKNHFSAEAKHVFNKYAGKELILLGYENDDRWINQNTL